MNTRNCRFLLKHLHGNTERSFLESNKICWTFLQCYSVSETETVSSNDKKPFVIPKPFLEDDILQTEKKFAKKDKMKEFVLRRRAFSDNDAANWSKKWPSKAPFDPYRLPFPLRMGYAQKKTIPPDAFANLELMKVQNFLHLTPPAIKEQCSTLKKFCTPFPSELKNDEECEKYYPVEVHSVDYISAGKTARDLRTRTITKKIRLCNMVLDAHARLKLIQLAGSERYDRKTDVLTIRSERCPTQKQNKDFIDYVITALYFESWKREAWETRGNMSESDGYYWWEDSQSERSI